MEVVKDQDLMAGLCAFLIDAEARKPDQRKRLFGGLWNASRSVYFDKPLIECYEWFRKLEEKVISVFPRATFSNRVGLCCDCGSVLKLDEHEVYLFLCNSCKEQRQIQETAKESQRKLEQAAKRREKKLGLVKIFSPEQVLAYPNHFLSLALYKAYGGKCQYCLMSSVLRKSQMVIEHIIPRSLSLDAVRDKLAELGISSEQIANFCSTLLPPHHNCILNLVPSCLKHNTEKNSVLLHPAALEFMLRKAKRKAKKVLEIYSQELHRGHRKGVIYE
jgi:5-methylcytosine-specific restriction endonuclease McrA